MGRNNDRVHAPENMILAAAAHLRRGGLVAFPTETVYGLGADATNPEAIARVFAAKGRPSHNPLIVHVDGETMAQGLVERWTSDARKLAAAFWPGPLSLVLPKKPLIPDLVTGGGRSVAVRCPDHEMTRRLIAAAGVPLVGPSANKSGFVSPTSAEHVRKEFEEAVVLVESAGPGRPRSHADADLNTILVLDGGTSTKGIESTVVRLPSAIGEAVVVLRQGVISADEIARLLGRSVEVQSANTQTPVADAALESPGLLDRHYAPRTRAFRFEAARWPDVLDALLDLVNPDGREARGVVLTIGSRSVPSPHVRLVMPSEPRAYAARLYAALREADECGATAIYVETPPDHGDPVWSAIADRVRRATEALA